MNITKWHISDIKLIIPSYMEYFNSDEDAQWTEQKVERRLLQLLVREDNLGLLMKNKKDFVGFVVDQLMQYDDGLVLELNELFIAAKYQNKGYGSKLLNEIEIRAKAKGAFRLQLTTGDDKKHHNFYNTKHDYSDCSNNIIKAKQL